MKRVVKMNVVLTGWLVLALILGMSSPSLAETESHDGGKAKTAETGSTARPKAAAVPLPAEYDQLLAALAKVDSRGLKVKDSLKIDAKGGETVEVSIADVVRLRNWVGTFKKYREMLTACAVKSDKSADLFGRFLDEFITKLQTAVTDDPKNASGLKEKELVTYVSQMEKFLKEKANLFSSSKADFEKADETLLKQLKETVGVFFSGYHESQFDAVRQAADADTKAVADKMTEAIGALAFRERNGGAVCKLVEEKSGEEKGKTEEQAKAKDEDSEDSEEQAKDESGKEEEKAKGKRAALDRPGPLEGETPTGEQPGGEQPGGEQPGGQQPGGQQPGGQTPVGDGGNIPVVDDGNIPFFDPGFNNANQDVVDDFNADALLRGLLDRFKDLEDQARDQQRLADQQIRDALAAAQRLADDIARQNQAALDAQRNNEDNGLADALKALQPPPPPQPPVIPPPPPPAIPPVASSGEGDRGATPFLPPQPQEEPLPPQGGGMPYPFMPQQQPSSPPIIIGEEKSRFEDDYYQRRATAIMPPQQNPQAAGLLELVRLQQQLMFAQQQAMQQPQVGVGVNVNSIANRLATSGGARTSRQLPTKANQTSTNRSTQGSTRNAPAGARSGTVPAAIRGSLAR